jgi:hypothetical protein
VAFGAFFMIAAQARAGDDTPPAGGAVQAAPAAAPKPADCLGHGCFTEDRAWVHTISARYDVGSASAYGVGYMFSRGTVTTGYPDAFFVSNLGLALDGRLVTSSHSRIDATVLSLAARASGSATFGGFGLELLGGVANPRQGAAEGLMSAGLFWSLQVLELGYSYQFPLGGGRGDWMSSHQFSVRINVPVYLQGRVTIERAP